MRTTIVQAIETVMREISKPLTAKEVYSAIVERELYTFKADSPLHVVRSQIRRHCEGLDFPSSSEIKLFRIHSDGKYFLRDAPATVPSADTNEPLNIPAEDPVITELRRQHATYLQDFRKRVVAALRELDPADFERFCRNLLTVYGFENVEVTRVSKDGGIDGHGRFRIGLGRINVAFQCKRYAGKTVGRPDVDRFRGAIQGQFEMGFFFATANFSADAERCSSKPGAVPVVLVNGPLIVDLMIEHDFGVERDNFPVYSLALDLALTDQT